MNSVLILGCGAIAGGYDRDRPLDAPPLTHAGAYSRDPQFAIAACVDPHGANREAFAREWSVQRQASTIEELGASAGEFDIISICSPTSLHAAHLAQALALRPRLIFCEKPVADKLADAERLVHACASDGIPLAVNYTRRWAPDLIALADEVREGHWGRLLSVAGWYAKGVIHNGGHMIDLFRMFAGELSLIAAGAPVFDHFEEDPTVSALLAADGGKPVHLIAGDSQAFTQFELVLTCEKGEIAMRDGGRRIETRLRLKSELFTGYRELGPIKSRPGRYPQAMTLAVANIADHLGHSQPLASTGVNALATQRLCEAIRTASLEMMKDKCDND